MLSYGMESLALLDILRLTEGVKWHKDTFTPRVAKVDKEIITTDYFDDVISIQGPGLLCCADVKAVLKVGCESGTMWFSVQIPGYESDVYGNFNDWWRATANLNPGQPVAIVYRSFVYFEDYLKLRAAYLKNSQYIQFSGTVWYVAL